MRVQTKERIIAVIGLSIVAFVIGLVIYVASTEPDRWVRARF